MRTEYLLLTCLCVVGLSMSQKGLMGSVALFEGLRLIYEHG